MWTSDSLKTVFALCAAVAFQIAVSPEASADAKFIPKDAKYESDGKLDFGTILFKDMKFKDFKATDFEVVNGKAVETYDTTFDALVKKGKGKKSVEFKGKIKKGFEPTKTKGKFDTEIVSMDLSGTAFGKSIKLKNNALLPSSGIAVFGPGKEPILNESSFDVFFKLSIGGDTPIPEVGGPSVFTLQKIPEPASLGLLLTGVLGLGVYRIREQRRKRE